MDSSLQGYVRRAAKSAARTSYGRHLAYLARQWRDVTAAEDALADAFRQQVETLSVELLSTTLRITISAGTASFRDGDLGI